jgi:hypothetical protein
MQTTADPSARILRAGALTIAGAVLALLAMAGPACRGGPTPSKVHTPLVITVYVPVPIPVQTPKPDPTKLTMVGCSHGTVGISSTTMPQPHWVIASLHLRSPRALKNLRLSSIELLDKAGKVVARSTRAEAFRIGKPRVSYPDRCLPYARQRPYHLTKANTRPFRGQITPGQRHRLWLHVRMAGDYFRIARTRPARCRITFTSSSGTPLKASINQVGSWPTG